MRLAGRVNRHESSSPLYSICISQFFEQNLHLLPVRRALGDQMEALQVRLDILLHRSRTKHTLAFLTSAGVSSMYILLAILATTC
jgi:hypothetical protein